MIAKLYSLNKQFINLNGKLLALPKLTAPLIIEIDTTKGNGFNSFTLPLTNHVTNCVVECSNGQIKYITNYLDKTIIFPKSGIYTLKIRGEAGWSFNNTGDCQKLTNILSWGSFKFSYLASGFYGCINLLSIPYAGSINTVASNLSWLFAGCNKLTCPIPPELLYTAPNCTDLTYLFIKCVNLKGQIPDYFLSKVPNLIYASGIFYDCQWLPPYIPQRLLWDVPKITNVSTMFYRCFIKSSIKASIPTELYKNNPKITNMSGVFRYAGVDGIFPFDYFDYTPLLNNVEYMLQSVGVLNISTLNIPISIILNITTFNGFLETTNVNGTATGIIQDIWTYASPTATKLNAFKNQIQLANYASIPNEWKGL